MGTFDDDIAVDWLEDLFDSDPFLFFRHCLDLDIDGFVNQAACVGVVCTAEMVLALLSEPRAGLPDAALHWLAKHKSLDVRALVPASIATLQQVIGEQSEMRQRWEDQQEQAQDWWSSMNDLQERLRRVSLSAAS